MLEVFSESALVGEVKVVGNLLHVLAGIAEHIFRFEDYIVVDPFGGGASGHLFDDVREVFRREKELRGIEGDVAVLAVVKQHEVVEIAHIVVAA